MEAFIVPDGSLGDMLIIGRGPYGAGIAYHGEDGEVWIIEAAMPQLLRHLEERVGEPMAGATPFDRANAGLVALAQRRESGFGWFTMWCKQAGVGYDRYAGDPAERVERWAPLQRRVDGEIRLLGVRFFPEQAGDRPRRRPSGLTVEEMYWSADFSTPYWYDVDVAYSDLATVLRRVGGVEPVDDDHEREDQWVAHLARQVEAGVLGGESARGASRNRVAQWYVEHDVVHALGGATRKVILLDQREAATRSMFVLLLVISADTRPATVKFVEVSQPIGRLDWTQGYDVTVPSEKIDDLIAYLTAAKGLVPPREQAPEERLVSCLRQLVGRGELTAGLPQRAMRARMVQWLGAAGAPVAIGRSLRTEVLLHRQREQTDSMVQLRLLIDPVGKTGIAFWEDYEYYARAGDAGREYGYGVKTPYESLEALVDSLEQRSGRAPEPTEDLEDRLVASMRRLVERGDLGARLPLRENRARVAAWFTEAGVPVKPDEWVWINSD